MIYSIGLVLFLLYSVLVFLIDSCIILSLLFVLNIMGFLIVKVKLKKYLKVLKMNFFIIIFIFLFNLVFGDLKLALLTSFKIYLVISTTYLFGYMYNPVKIADSFYYLLSPLKLFKVDTKELSLTIAIALAFIPILSDEAKNIKMALLSKGMDFNLKNVITRPHIYLITYLNSLFSRIDELELSFKMKGYQ